MSEFEKDRCNRTQTPECFCSIDTSRLISCNVFTGTVISLTRGLTRTSLRVRVGEQTDLRVRWPASNPAYDDVDVGHTVCLSIPEDAVIIEAGAFRRSKQRWNRWIGRVVLVQRHNGVLVTTVKIHRDTITLKSRGQAFDQQTQLKSWDTVNIVIDPQKISLTPMSAASDGRSLSRVPPASPKASVWLRASIRSIRWSPAGFDVALNVGGVNLSTLMDTDPDTLSGWTVGSSVEITISHYEAWIRLHRKSPLLRCRVVFFSESRGPQLPDP